MREGGREGLLPRRRTWWRCRRACPSWKPRAPGSGCRAAAGTRGASSPARARRRSRRREGERCPWRWSMGRSRRGNGRLAGGERKVAAGARRSVREEGENAFFFACVGGEGGRESLCQCQTASCSLPCLPKWTATEGGSKALLSLSLEEWKGRRSSQQSASPNLNKKCLLFTRFTGWLYVHTNTIQYRVSFTTRNCRNTVPILCSILLFEKWKEGSFLPFWKCMFMSTQTGGVHLFNKKWI